ncbi:hypothetical protein D5R81_19460 [Parashewanella spongiae]|uniref:WG repeat-containing protein n=1 Tax=Parashewanella spongiae TaxID=342950 RepID=A0A3A6SUD0_9GAMM|nr:hypothetical protein [Parashewanella spongiae]MCL1080192.1 hypothetical protein [Parashewanella spongiae]RJY02186.1 hypothetical protein D5R81_19460 [Parashewanella spongiae]
MRNVLFLLSILSISGCAVGHNDFVNYRDNDIGTVMIYKMPFKFKNSGELRRGDFAITGQGLTHIDKDTDGNLIYHFSDQEILPHFHKKEWIGKCLTYYVVNPTTFIIKSWGFDKGGNPLSCRTWS